MKKFSLFLTLISDIKSRKKCKVILIHPKQVSEVLKMSGTMSICYRNCFDFFFQKE